MGRVSQTDDLILFDNFRKRLNYTYIKCEYEHIKLFSMSSQNNDSLDNQNVEIQTSKIELLYRNRLILY